LTRDTDTSADDLKAIRYPLEAAAKRARSAALAGAPASGEARTAKMLLSSVKESDGWNELAADAKQHCEQQPKETA
jgi:hypothetical protein